MADIHGTKSEPKVGLDLFGQHPDNEKNLGPGAAVTVRLAMSKRQREPAALILIVAWVSPVLTIQARIEVTLTTIIDFICVGFSWLWIQLYPPACYGAFDSPNLLAPAPLPPNQRSKAQES